jgi:DNA mismatch endonuclease (patch repair protein)
MVDNLTPFRRAENMRHIEGKGTKPEMLVRSLVYGLGYRYRLHRRELPGKPDLVFGSRKKAILVHGCFWHSHDDPACVDGCRKPKSNLDYWLPKLARNKARDIAQEAELIRLGWSVLTIWECETTHQDKLAGRIKAFLD